MSEVRCCQESIVLRFVPTGRTSNGEPSMIKGVVGHIGRFVIVIERFDKV